MKVYKSLPMIAPSYEGFPLPYLHVQGITYDWGLANPYNQLTVTPPLPGDYILEIKRVVIDAPGREVKEIEWLPKPIFPLELKWGETILAQKVVYGGWTVICEWGLAPPVVVAISNDEMF